MSTPWIHLNPKIFPDPLSFQPERFLEKPHLKRYIMSFSQGSRQCLGMQLAYAELYLVLSGVWRRFGGPSSTDTGTIPEGYGGRMELFETDRRDVEMQPEDSLLRAGMLTCILRPPARSLAVWFGLIFGGPEGSGDDGLSSVLSEDGGHIRWEWFAADA